MKPKKKLGKKDVTVRNPDHRLLACYLDKQVLHNLKVEAAKKNLSVTEFVRYIVDQAIEDEDLQPPMKEL